MPQRERDEVLGFFTSLRDDVVEVRTPVTALTHMAVGRGSPAALTRLD